MTRFALGAKCGSEGKPSTSCCAIEFSAIAPTETPVHWPRKYLRERSTSNIERSTFNGESVVRESFGILKVKRWKFEVERLKWLSGFLLRRSNAGEENADQLIRL